MSAEHNDTDSPPLVVAILTKNEEANIEACLQSVRLIGAPAVVIDSLSEDRTPTLARSAGADVVTFCWDGQYPKKKQWTVDHVSTTYSASWVLLLDADERVSDDLASFVRKIVAPNASPTAVAFRFPIEYRFGGGRNSHGFQAKKIALFRPDRTHFSPRDDLDLPNGWEVEGHYQPDVTGVVATAPVPIVHDDADHLHDWIDRHNRYSDWSSHLEHHQGRVADNSESLAKRTFERLPFRGLVAFVDSYILRRGFLDGSAGFDFAVARAMYYWMGAAKRRELQRRQPAK